MGGSESIDKSPKPYGPTLMPLIYFLNRFFAKPKLNELCRLQKNFGYGNSKANDPRKY